MPSLMAKMVRYTITQEDTHRSCGICLDDKEPGDIVSRTPCNHWYCTGCIATWLEEHVTCPACRCALGERQIRIALPRETTPEFGASDEGERDGPRTGMRAFLRSHDRIPANDADDAARFQRLENELVMLHRAYVENPFGWLGVLNYNPARSSPIGEMRALAAQLDAHDDLEGNFGAQSWRARHTWSSDSRLGLGETPTRQSRRLRDLPTWRALNAPHLDQDSGAVGRSVTRQPETAESVAGAQQQLPDRDNDGFERVGGRRDGLHDGLGLRVAPWARRENLLRMNGNAFEDPDTETLARVRMAWEAAINPRGLGTEGVHPSNLSARSTRTADPFHWDADSEDEDEDTIEVLGAMNGTAHEAETQLHGYIDFQAEFDVDADRRDRRMR